MKQFACHSSQIWDRASFSKARCHHHHLVHLGEYFHGDHFWKILAFSRRNLRLFTFFRIPSALARGACSPAHCNGTYSAYERSRDWGNAKCDGFAYRNMYALFHAWLIGCVKKKKRKTLRHPKSNKKNMPKLYYSTSLVALQGGKKVLAPPIIQNMAYFDSFMQKVWKNLTLLGFRCGKWSI